MDGEDFSESNDFRMQTQKQKPIHEVRLGLVKAAVWKNETDTGARYNVTVSRLYKENGEKDWKHTDSFGRDDLLLLGKVVDQVHTWIHAQAQPQDEEKATNHRR